MNLPDHSQPPRDLPIWGKYILGLASDASKDEIAAAWNATVVPLMGIGPEFLFNREANQIMAAGLTGTQARRLFKSTKRGAMLADHAEREGKARERAKNAKPPFLP